jgi:galactokinase/galacturonokinase
VFFSGLERSLASSKFNMRVDEARAAAYAVKAYSGMDYGKIEETNLRDVPYDTFLEYADRLPVNWRKRAEHFYGEIDRVDKGAAAWRRGDLAAFGALITQSGNSSINCWETGSPELIKLHEIITSTRGVYGGRFSGAGFKGCCMALVDPSRKDEITRAVTDGYLAAFPGLRGKFSVCYCHTADGVAARA